MLVSTSLGGRADDGCGCGWGWGWEEGHMLVVEVLDAAEKGREDEDGEGFAVEGEVVVEDGAKEEATGVAEEGESGCGAAGCSWERMSR